jgi:hypothetical protein
MDLGDARHAAMDHCTLPHAAMDRGAVTGLDDAALYLGDALCVAANLSDARWNWARGYGTGRRATRSVDHGDLRHAAMSLGDARHAATNPAARDTQRWIRATRVTDLGDVRHAAMNFGDALSGLGAQLWTGPRATRCDGSW